MLRSLQPKRLVAALAAASLAFCPAGSTAPARPPTPTVATQPIDWFEDATRSAGIDFSHHFPHSRIANIVLSNGSGVTVLDINNDGWMDLFFLNWGPLEGVSDKASANLRPGPRLYRNRGNGTFEDVTAASGLAQSAFSSAAAAGDFDNDGFTDLYVVNVGRNTLYRNRGNGTFEDVTAGSGTGHTGTGISAVWLDYDHDGRLDLYLANYLTYIPEKESEQNPGAYPGPLAYAGEPNVLYRNRGNGTFEDVTAQTGLLTPGHRGMSVAALDANLDGHTDLYLSNDDTPNQLWLNDGKGRFRDTAIESGAAFNSIGEAPGSMNAAIADANLDGWPDLFITRLGYGSLYVRNAQGLYDDRMWASGLGLLTQKYVGWGGAFLDMDNDGDPDLLIGNGDAFKLDGTLPLLLENDGTGRFTDAGPKGGALFRTAINARGNAIVDLDNDGRLDAVFTVLADRPFVLRNRSPLKNHWLSLRLQGTRSNRSGYGALITLTAGKQTHRAESTPHTGFLSQGDPRVHFGLANATQVDRLEIRWPSGTVQTLNNIPADQVFKVVEPQ